MKKIKKDSEKFTTNVLAELHPADYILMKKFVDKYYHFNDVVEIMQKYARDIAVEFATELDFNEDIDFFEKLEDNYKAFDEWIKE